MQEEIENRTINLVISMTRLSGRGIVNASRFFINKARYGRSGNSKNGAMYQGRKKVKDLVGQGDSVTSVPVTDRRIRDFEQVARKYGVQFAVMKKREKGNHRYLVFFKVKDMELFQIVMDEYTKKMLQKREHERPSVMKQLNRFKEMVRTDRTKTVNRNRERERSR